MTVTPARPASDDPAVSVAFLVTVDTLGLGAFSKCEGLGIEVVVEQREEGGQNGWTWQLPSRIKYPNIKLTRPVTEDTVKVGEWFANVIRAPKRYSATIVAMRLDGSTVASWDVRDAMPVRWTGPQFDLDSAKVATETIEIAHHGFTVSRG